MWWVVVVVMVEFNKIQFTVTLKHSDDRETNTKTTMYPEKLSFQEVHCLLKDNTFFLSFARWYVRQSFNIITKKYVNSYSPKAFLISIISSINHKNHKNR